MEAEVALVRVGVTGAARTEILRVAKHLHATVVEYRERAFTMRVCDTAATVDRFIAAVRVHCASAEVVRSGPISISAAPAGAG